MKFLGKNVYKIIAILCLTMLFVFYTTNKKNDRDLTNRIQLLVVLTTEKAYAEGQADAIKGDVRIHPIGDSTYVYIKSPWDNGMKPMNDTIIIR
jgi:hypothetical protein